MKNAAAQEDYRTYSPPRLEAILAEASRRLSAETAQEVWYQAKAIDEATAGSRKDGAMKEVNERARAVRKQALAVRWESNGHSLPDEIRAQLTRRHYGF